MPNDFTPEWYERTLRELSGAFQRANRWPAFETGAQLLHMIREQGKSIQDVEQLLGAGRQPEPPRPEPPRPEPPRPGPVSGADMVDLSDAVVHASPPDVAQWPITVRILTLQMFPNSHPRAGLNFTFGPVPDTWDFHVPGWGGGNDPGNLLYTVWAAAQIAGRWHAGAFIQMWRGRENTGAPILTDWTPNWVEGNPGQRRLWGDEMAGHVARPGDQMAFFVTAGNARLQRGPTSVRERSNIVLVNLPAGDSGTFTF